MTASKRISKRVDQILPRPQSKRTMKNSADRISPIKGQNLPPQRFANYAKTEWQRKPLHNHQLPGGFKLH
nr:hypothetical protein [uncultured Campylobacter sp.]